MAVSLAGVGLSVVAGSVLLESRPVLSVSHACSEASAGAFGQPWCVTLSMPMPALA